MKQVFFIITSITSTLAQTHSGTAHPKAVMKEYLFEQLFTANH